MWGREETLGENHLALPFSLNVVVIYSEMPGQVLCLWASAEKQMLRLSAMKKTKSRVDSV